MGYRAIMLINKCNIIRRGLREPNHKHEDGLIKSSKVGKLSCLLEKESYVMKHDSGRKIATEVDKSVRGAPMTRPETKKQG